MSHRIRTICVPSLVLIVAIAGRNPRAPSCSRAGRRRTSMRSRTSTRNGRRPRGGGPLRILRQYRAAGGDGRGHVVPAGGIDAIPVGILHSAVHRHDRGSGGPLRRRRRRALRGLAHLRELRQGLDHRRARDLSYLSAYNSGNIVRAESNATVLDLLTITQPVQLDLQGHVSGNIGMTISSAAEILGITGRTSEMAGRRKCEHQAGFDPDREYGAHPREPLFAGLRSVHPIRSGFRRDDPDAPTWRLPAQGGVPDATRIGSVSRPNLAVQNMHSDFGQTVTLRIVADVRGGHLGFGSAHLRAGAVYRGARGRRCE